jgi:hypothetical protein
MGQLKTELLNKLKDFPPFEQIASLYEDKSLFVKELENYLVGGMVFSTPTMFMMLKPVDSTIDPNGQWYAQKPDCWYIRWAAGRGYLKAMMDIIEPLPKVMFRRITENGETDLRTYKWEQMYKKVSK